MLSFTGLAAAVQLWLVAFLASLMEIPQRGPWRDADDADRSDRTDSAAPSRAVPPPADDG